MTRSLPRIALGLALALALAVAGCGDDDAGTTSEPTTTAATSTVPDTTASTATTAPTTTAATTTTTAPTTTASTTTSAFAGDTDPKSASIQGIPSGLLTDVRFAPRAEGFTRIVFDFRGTDGIPGYNIEYQTGPFLNMGEVVVPVAGTAFIAVRMFPAIRVDLSVDPYVYTYTGPDRIAANTASVEEIVFLEDFEADMVWIIGLTGRKPFNVGTLTNPPRIYVDIAD